MKTKLLNRILLCASLACGVVAHAAEIVYSCAGQGQELSLCKKSVEEWSKKSGHKVKVLSAPNSTTERLALYQQLLAAKSSDIDIFPIDVIWPSILGSHFEDLTPYVTQEIKNLYFPAIVENNTVQGKLIALPWYTDAGLLYYRKDLLEKYKIPVPKTWEEMGDAAKKIQEGERKAGNAQMWGYVFQGRAYEGLTCNALEWISSNNGGTIVNDKGEVTVNNPNAIAAVTLVAGWVDSIVPRGALNYSEEEARGVFQSGNAVFMRNWPYAWKLANEKGSAVKGKVGVTLLPRGKDGKHTATLGGWSLALSKYSKNKAAAADLLKYLTSSPSQKVHALEGGYNPTIPALYKDKDILKANPFMGELYETFVGAIARPSRSTGSQYNRVSAEFWDAVHRVLSKEEDAKTAFASLEQKFKRMSRKGKW